MVGEDGRGASDGPHAVTRPVGWWLKEADALLDAAFDAALAGTGVDRRGWQIMSTLARQPVARSALLAALAPFDPPPVLDRAVEVARDRGWVEDDGDVLRLTSAGIAQQRAVGARVDGVRSRVAAALPPEDYLELVRLLARLVEGLRRWRVDAAPAPPPARARSGLPDGEGQLP